MLASHFRFAHLSDLHFFHMSWDVRHFFSKRLIGIGNFLLRRQREFNHTLLHDLSSILIQEKVPFALISGDVSCTATEYEFQKALNFLSSLQKQGIDTLTLPGNHDKYTKKAAKEEIFYRSFPSSLSFDGLHIRNLSSSWWMIALDTTIPTPLFCCHGHFSKDLEDKLTQALDALPSDANVILANHFPIFEKKKKDLEREDALIALCKRYKKIRLYLHGHTHKPKIHDAREEGLPIIVDAGSAVHQFSGGWNLIEGQENTVTITPFIWKMHKWVQTPSSTFTWDS